MFSILKFYHEVLDDRALHRNSDDTLVKILRSENSARYLVVTEKYARYTCNLLVKFTKKIETSFFILRFCSYFKPRLIIVLYRTALMKIYQCLDAIKLSSLRFF